MLDQTPIAVVDLELTGLDLDRDRICEVGIVRAMGDRIIESWSTLVRPGCPMGVVPARMTGLDDSTLSRAPTWESVVDEVGARLEGHVVVGHRADFDHHFLIQAFVGAGRPAPPAPTFDTLLMARHLLALRSHALGSLCEVLRVPQPRAHRALADALVTYRVFRKLVAIFAPDGEAGIAQLVAEIDALAPGSERRAAQKRALQQARQARRTVWLSYVSAEEGGGGLCAREREVAVWRVDPPRVQGWCYLRGAERVFRMERIRQVKEAGRAYEIPVFETRT